MQHGWWAARARLGQPGKPSDVAVRWLRRLALPVVRLCHRPTLEGTEHLPEGPYALVANHSAGLGLAEILSLAALWADRFGASRPLAGFAYPLSFHVWPLAAILRAFGAIPSTREAGAATLAAGVPVLIFPGGMHETFRPIWQAHRVDFGGHAGFLQVVRDAKVPVLPMGIRGSHFTAPVLWRSRLLSYLLVTPRLLGCKVWPVTLLGVIVAAALALALPVGAAWRALAVWLWLGSPMIFLSIIPATIRFRIGPPVSPDSLEHVQAAVQAMVDADAPANQNAALSP